MKGEAETPIALEQSPNETGEPQHFASPKVGDIIEIGWGKIKCRVSEIHPFGTIDVIALDCSKAYRVSGLPFIINRTARFE